MKKILFLGILGIFFLGSCHNQKHSTDERSHEHEHAGQIHTHAGCDHDHDHDHNHDHDHDHDHDHRHNTLPGHGAGSDEIIISKESAEEAGIRSERIEPGVFNQVIKTSGQVVAAQGDESVAVATISGVITFRDRIVEGMPVNKGAPLLTVSAKNLAEGDPVERARIDYETAKKEYERLKPLAANKIVTEKDFVQAQQTYENARLSYESLAQHHTRGGQTIPSPIGGYIKSIYVKEGDYVELGQPLVSITRNKRLYLRAEVSEKYYSRLRTITSANFKTPYDNRTYLLDQLNGKLLSFGKSSGDASFYVPVTFEFDNVGDILPGSFVEIYLLSTPVPDTITLPHAALTEEQGSYFVYVQLDEECYKKQGVTLGGDNGDRVQILSGVNPGDRIVTEGAYRVKLASATNVLPAHTH